MIEIDELYDGNGNKIKLHMAKKPGLCLLCKRDDIDDPMEHLLCAMNRVGQQDAEEFQCGVFEKKSLWHSTPSKNVYLQKKDTGMDSLFFFWPLEAYSILQKASSRVVDVAFSLSSFHTPSRSQPLKGSKILSFLRSLIDGLSRRGGQKRKSNEFLMDTKWANIHLQDFFRGVGSFSLKSSGLFSPNSL